MIKRKHMGILSCCAALVLTACVSVLPEPEAAPTVYRLGISDGGDVQNSANPVIINIELPDATKYLSSTDIVVSPDGRRLTAAANASWSEPIPRMVRAALVDTLAGNPDIAGVIPKGSTLTPYRINMNIRRFEAVFDRGDASAPLGVMQVNLALTRTKDRALVATKTVRVDQRANSINVSSIVETMDAINNEVMEQIEDWISANAVPVVN